MARTRCAIVLGGGLAGRPAATVLARYVDDVTVVDRGGFPDDLQPRKGFPQGRRALESGNDAIPEGRDLIAVVGSACRLPPAGNPGEFWRLLADGVDVVTEFSADRWAEALPAIQNWRPVSRTTLAAARSSTGSMNSTRSSSASHRTRRLTWIRGSGWRSS